MLIGFVETLKFDEVKLFFNKSKTEIDVAIDSILIFSFYILL